MVAGSLGEPAGDERRSRRNAATGRTGSAGTPGAGTLMLGVLVVTVLAALCAVVVKAGLGYAPPLFFGGLRALIAGTVLLGLALLGGHPLLPAPRRWPALLALSLVATTATYGGMFLSPGRVGAGIASVLGNVQPLVAVLLAALVLHERLTRAKIAAVLLGTGGVLLITYPRLAGGLSEGMVGSLFALSASIGAAAGSVLVKRMDLRGELLAVTGWQLVLGSLPLLGAAALLEPLGETTWGAAFAGMLLFLSLGGTALSTTIWFWLLGHGDVGRLSLFLFLVPVLGLAFAWVVFGERVAPLETAGMLAIFVGTALVLGEPARAQPRS